MIDHRFSQSGVNGWNGKSNSPRFAAGTEKCGMAYSGKPHYWPVWLERDTVISTIQEHRAEFEGRYSRCRNSFYFLAWGALGNAGQAEEAMENGYRKACRQPKRFTSDGEFGSWMIRILINEIVLVANRQTPETSEMSEAEFPEAR